MVCRNIKYEVPNGLPLSSCIYWRDHINEYNKKQGISNYMDPFARLFCVRFDRSPVMDYYWTDITDQSIDVLLENASGFEKAILGETGSS